MLRQKRRRWCRKGLFWKEDEGKGAGKEVGGCLGEALGEVLAGVGHGDGGGLGRGQKPDGPDERRTAAESSGEGRPGIAEANLTTDPFLSRQMRGGGRGGGRHGDHRSR
jgi:hypothetical protein